jgi:hypothetical protein
MKKIAVLLFLICSLTAYSQVPILSNRAEISVITCGPTQDELYSAFGHNAFKVVDPDLGISEAYNYGVFDFDQPHFYMNFTRGHLNYKLGVYDYQAFENYYVRNNRYVHEQVLNLTQSQKQQLYTYLQWNALRENQGYRYDYFYDNCATKMRDVVVDVFGLAVDFDGSYVKTNYTIRELTDIYLKEQPWGDLGIDLCLGLPMDKKATPYEYMFLPDYVESGFNHATITHDGVKKPLVKETVKIYEARVEDAPESLPNPLYVFSFVALLSIALTVWDLKRKKLSMWFDVLLFGVAGLLGMLFVFLWFATDHKAAMNNLNILWALPTHTIAVLAFIRQPAGLKKYFLVTAIIAVLLLLSWPFLPQQLHYALIPVVIMLAIRAYAQYKLRK